MLVVTRWLVAGGCGTVLLALAWPALFGGAARGAPAIARLEALAAWTESLRDTIAGAVGLEQAIPATRVPRPRRSARTCACWSTGCASGRRCRTRSRLFADELDDPSADLVVAALILNSRLRGPGLREVLGALAESAREELDMRRRVEAEPALHPAQRADRGRRHARVRRRPGRCSTASYVEPYDDAGRPGRAARRGRRSSAAAFVWLRRLASFDKPGRFLHGRASGRRGTPHD